MNKLAYTRELPYFSPSSFLKFGENPIEFYINRLGPIENRPPRDPTGMPQAVGLMFDELVKSMIENRKPVYDERALLIEGSLDRSIALAATYVACGAYSRLVSEGDLAGSTGRCEVKLEGFVPGTLVPIMGYIDTVLQSAWLDRLFPHDFKVTGAGTPMTARSPNKGYLRHYEGGVLTPKIHKLSGESFHLLNEKWATQLVFYGWLLGWGIEKIPYGLDQCLFSKGQVRIGQYRGWIDKSFVQQLAVRVSSAWDIVQEERVVPAGLVDPDFLALIS